MNVINSKILKKLEKYFDYASKKAARIEGESHKKISKPVRLLLVSVVVSMIMTKSVVYTELAEELNEEAQLDSNVRRIRKWELSLDRTNWKYGNSSLNILAVTVWVKGVGVPIWFELLDNKGGNSTQEIRVTIFDKLIRLFINGCIKKEFGT